MRSNASPEHSSDDVWVVAPEHGPVRLCAFAVDLGAAAAAQDRRQALCCARHADRLRHHGREERSCPDLPDLILSGVNSGANIADDVTYSGTVAGAMEGALLGIRSIALSQAYNYVGEDARRSLRNDRGAGAGAAQQAARNADCRTACCSMSIFRTACQKRSPARSLPRRASWSTACGSRSARDGRGLPYYWLRFGREPADGSKAPTWRPAQTGWFR